MLPGFINYIYGLMFMSNSCFSKSLSRGLFQYISSGLSFSNKHVPGTMKVKFVQSIYAHNELHLTLFTTIKINPGVFLFPDTLRISIHQTGWKTSHNLRMVHAIVLIINSCKPLMNESHDIVEEIVLHCVRCKFIHKSHSSHRRSHQ